MWGEEVANFPSIVILTKRNKQRIYSDTHTRQKINTNKELEKKKKDGTMSERWRNLRTYTVILDKLH